MTLNLLELAAADRTDARVKSYSVSLGRGQCLVLRRESSSVPVFGLVLTNSSEVEAVEGLRGKFTGDRRGMYTLLLALSTIMARVDREGLPGE